jgi:hypothetical protein
MTALHNNRRSGRCQRLAVLFLLAVCATGTRADDDPRASGDGQLAVEPERVEINLLFGGTDLTVRAEVPPGYEAAVRLIGPRQQVQLQRKGRVWGVLWTGVERITIDDAPAAYMLATSAPLTDRVAADDLVTHDLGRAALLPEDDPERDVFRELMKLRQREGLYAESIGGLSLTHSGAGGAPTVEATFHLPARIAPGTYTIGVFGFHGDDIRPIGSTTIQVERVGLVRDLHALAMEHGLLYGCAAAIVAIVAGLLTGLVFGLRSSKARWRSRRTGE